MTTLAPPPETTRLLLDVRRAAALLSVSPAMMWKLVRTGRITSVKLGKRRLFPVADLQDYVESLKGVKDAS